MDKLVLAAKLAHARAKEKVLAGKMPSFLGIQGMLALMHERIINYSESTDDDYILELAADAVYALFVTLPETTTEENSPVPVELPEDSPRSIDDIPDEPTEGLTPIGPDQ